VQKEFLNISQNTLKFVVEQNFLTQCNEATLIEAVEQWARFHLQKNNIKVSQENLRRVLGESVVISKLRYRSLSQAQLVHVSKKTELLSKEEKLNLLECCVTKSCEDLMDIFNSHRYSR
jgi:BTB And C-terminal Kelch